jgi:transposase
MHGMDLGFTTSGCCDSTWLLDCGGQRWMTRPYSLDLRERMVRAVEAGASRRGTAAKFEVSSSCVIKLMRRWRQKGTLAPEPVRGGRRAKLANHAERVDALLAAVPDSTLAELQARLAAAGIAVSPSAISRFLIACGLTRKKRPRTPPSRTAPMSPPPGVPGARNSRA